MKSSPTTPEGQNGGPKPRPALSPAMRLAIFIVVVIVAAVLIESQVSKNAVDVNLEPPFDASVMRPRPKAPAGRLIFVPNDDGQLRRVTLKDAPPPTSTSDAAKTYMSNAAFVMKHLLKEAPNDFPAGTRLLAVKVDEDKKVASVDFSKEFANADFYQGSTRTLATVYSVVNTVAAVNPAVADKVQILVNGKPVDLLGELDASEPFEPDTKLVASS